MKRIVYLLSVLVLTGLAPLSAAAEYVPAKENLESRQAFEGFRFGIFLHWGIYSEFAQGEWYLQFGNLNKDEYAKAASCFYPLHFNADEWVRAFKESGAKYITFTSRHHDGFSMFKTAESRYNIVDATPFGRDVVGELAEACYKQGLRFHLYYSILDWIREDYPLVQYDLLKDQMDESVILEWNPGNHFQDFIKRKSRAFNWIMNRI